MGSFATVNAGSRRVDLHAFTGSVIDQEKATHTEVVRNGNTNQVAQTRVASYNTIFLRNDAGEERSLQITDGLALRMGNRASFVWGIPQGKQDGDYVAVVNHDSGNRHIIRKATNDLASPPFYNMLLIVAAFVGAYGLFDLFSGNLFSALMLLGIGGGGIYWIYKRQKVFIAVVDQAIRAHLAA